MAALPSPESSPPPTVASSSALQPSSRKRQRSHSMESTHSESNRRTTRAGDISNLSLSDPMTSNDNSNINDENIVDIETYLAEQGYDNDFQPMSQSTDMDNSNPPPAEKYNIISTKQKRALKLGETWFIVAKSWFDPWRRSCTGDHGKEVPVAESTITAVDNSSLIQDGYLLSNDVVDGVNIELVPADAWELLVQWYGPPIHELPRPTIARGRAQEVSVELHPPRLRVIRLTRRKPSPSWSLAPQDSVTHPILDISSQMMITDMRQKFAAACNNEQLPTGAFRVWKVTCDFDEYPQLPYESIKNSKPTLIEDSNTTVEESGIIDEDSFAVEYEDDKGWIVEEQKEEEDGNPPALFNGPSFFDQLAAISSSKPSTTDTPSSSGKKQMRLWENKEKDKDKALEPGTLGLGNMGNTCFMNSALQCLAHQRELVEYFLNDVYDGELNRDNPLGMGGAIAEAFGALMRRIWAKTGPSNSYSPREFKMQLQRFAPQFAGYQQHDSQELVAFLLDGLHEDLNRVLKKPYVEKPDWEGGGDKELAELAQTSWEGYMKRNDSVIVDLFQGQYQSTLICPECQKVSITFDPFMYLTLPLPIQKKWRHDVYYIPWDLDQPHVKVPVELNANSSFKDLRNLLGRWMGANPDNLLTMEIWSDKFYKNLGDHVPVSDATDNDNIVCFELPCHARQSRSYKAKATPEDPFVLAVYLCESPTSSSSTMTRHVGFGRGREGLFGYPMVIAIDRNKAVSPEAVYEQVVNRLQRWTRQARDLFHWEEEHDPSDVDGTPMVVSPVPTARDSLAEIRENGDVVHVQEDGGESMMEESDIVDEKGAVLEPMVEDLSSLDSSVADGSLGVPVKRGPKNDLFELKLLAGHEDYGVGQFSSPRFESWDARVAEVHKEDGEGAPVLKENDALYCEFDENMKAFYFGEKTTYEHARWDKWEEYVHPEYEAATKAAGSKKSHQIDLEACLDEFTKEEQLGEEDLWYCPQCKKHQQATKKFDLWKAPDVLVVHLKRFSNSRMLRDKIDAFIDFPTEALDLGNRVGERALADRLSAQGLAPEEFGIQNHSQPLLYDLFAVDEHMGGLGGGHYRAYAQNHLSGKWHHFDDSYVTPAQPQDSVNANAYLLFYRRRSQDSLGGASYRKVEEATARKAQEEEVQEQDLQEQQHKLDDRQLPTPPSETVSVSSSSPSHRPTTLDSDWTRLPSNRDDDDDQLVEFDSPPRRLRSGTLNASTMMGFDFPNPANHASPSSSVDAEADPDELDDMEDWGSSAAVSGLASPISSVSDLTSLE